jgi:hypothetical protein
MSAPRPRYGRAKSRARYSHTRVRLDSCGLQTSLILVNAPILVVQAPWSGCTPSPIYKACQPLNGLQRSAIYGLRSRTGAKRACAVPSTHSRSGPNWAQWKCQSAMQRTLFL